LGRLVAQLAVAAYAVVDPDADRLPSVAGSIPSTRTEPSVESSNPSGERKCAAVLQQRRGVRRGALDHPLVGGHRLRGDVVLRRAGEQAELVVLDEDSPDRLVRLGHRDRAVPHRGLDGLRGEVREDPCPPLIPLLADSHREQPASTEAIIR